jgi:hypothetical protein
MLDQRQSPDKKLLRRLYLGFGMLFNGPISVQWTETGEHHFPADVSRYKYLQQTLLQTLQVRGVE